MKARIIDEKATEFMNEIDEVIDNIIKNQESVGIILSRKECLDEVKKYIKERVKSSEINKARLLEEIEKRLNVEEENLYYEQVRRYTNNFEFLTELPELRISRGYKVGKFTDKESLDKYMDLVSKLQKCAKDEYSQILIFLDYKNISDEDRRILNARKLVIEKNKELEER